MAPFEHVKMLDPLVTQLCCQAEKKGSKSYGICWHIVSTTTQSQENAMKKLSFSDNYQLNSISYTTDKL